MPRIARLSGLIAIFLIGVAGAQTMPAGGGAIVDSAAMKQFEAQVTAVQGQVSRIRDQQPWALSDGEHVPVAQVIMTGKDGYAHFSMAGGNHFDIFSNSRVIFRQNTADTGDLVDILSGRIRVHMEPKPGQRQRVFCPTAVVSSFQRATVSLAVDEDNAVRIDVSEGEVRVQHALRPDNVPVVVRAVDAILIEPNEPISRRVDRGSLYRYTARIWAAITFSHDRSGQPVEGNKLAARNATRFCF